jgi:hypothetical protein
MVGALMTTQNAIAPTIYQGWQVAAQPASPFTYIRFDAAFCALLERSAQLAGDAPNKAILSRLNTFTPWLIPMLNSIDETPLQGVWTLVFDGRVSRTPFQAIDTSGLLRTVGTYMLTDGGYAVNVRLVK